MPAKAASCGRSPKKIIVYTRAPIWENAFLNGVGSRVDEAALTLVTAYPYTAPFDDLRLKR